MPNRTARLLNLSLFGNRETAKAGWIPGIEWSAPERP
jgi:hypothetical protein